MPDYVTILRIRGPFLFGTTDKLAAETPDLKKFAPVVILRLRHMTAIDATGLHAIEMFANRIKQAGKILLLCGARDQPAQFNAQSDFVEHIGRENFLPHVQAALDRAREIIEDFDGVGQDVAREYTAHAPL
jgi:SulP family sulfate permease